MSKAEVKKHALDEIRARRFAVSRKATPCCVACIVAIMHMLIELHRIKLLSKSAVMNANEFKLWVLDEEMEKKARFSQSFTSFTTHEDL